MDLGAVVRRQRHVIDGTRDLDLGPVVGRDIDEGCDRARYVERLGGCAPPVRSDETVSLVPLTSVVRNS